MPSASQRIRVKASDIAKDTWLTVDVTGMQTWRWQIKLGCLFIRFGAWLARFNYERKDV